MHGWLPNRKPNRKPNRNPNRDWMGRYLSLTVTLFQNLTLTVTLIRNLTVIGRYLTLHDTVLIPYIYIPLDRIV